jgi:hypothetical protein
MKKFVYSVWFGNAPNRQQKVFVKWTDVVKYIKKEVDSGSIIHSIQKEWAEDFDYGDRLVKALDVIGDR